jgi:hypothetical protein
MIDPNIPTIGSGNGNSGFDDHKNTPFKEFRGCTARQKKDIVESWFDVAHLAGLAADTDFSNKPGVLESRVFGFDVHERGNAGYFINSELPSFHRVPQ